MKYDIDDIINHNCIYRSSVLTKHQEGHLVSLFMTRTLVNVDMVSSCDTCEYHVIMRYYINKTCKWICIIFFLVFITQLFVILKKYFFTFNSRWKIILFLHVIFTVLFRLIFYDDTTSTIPLGWTEKLSNDLKLDQELQQIEKLNVPFHNFSFHPSCSCKRCNYISRRYYFNQNNLG